MNAFAKVDKEVTLRLAAMSAEERDGVMEPADEPDDRFTTVRPFGSLRPFLHRPQPMISTSRPRTA